MITNISDLDFNGTYSYADYLQWQFEETIELIKGKITRMSPAPKRVHQEASRYLVKPLEQFFEHHECKLYFAPFDVRLHKNLIEGNKNVFTVVQPDICVVCDLSKLDDNGCVGAPDLIIEITSKSTRQRDFQLKYCVYEEAGVQEYWIAEPIEKVIYQNHLVNGKYELVAILGEGETLKSRHFPGLEVEISEVFRS